MTRRSMQLGLSLIELMVAMAIGLVVMLVVYQLFAVSESTRRTSVGGSDAQMSAAIAVSALQDQIRNAGFGLGGMTASTAKPGSARVIGCYVNGVDLRPAPTGSGGPFSFVLAPAIIVQGANNDAAGNGTDSDIIRVVYSDLDYPTVPVNLVAGMTSPTVDMTLTNRYGVKAGSVFVMLATPSDLTPPQVMATPAPAQRVLPAPFTPAQAQTYVPPPHICGLGEVNGVVGSNVIQHGSAPYLDPETNANTAVRFNGGGGIGAGGLQFSNASSLFNLGKNPSVVTFTVQNNQLMLSNLLGNATPQALVDGVVSLQAQYGVGVDLVDSTGATTPDGFADGGVCGWTNNIATAPAAWSCGTAYTPIDPTTGAVKWGLVVAVRFAVLTRGNQLERKDTTNACTATPAGSPELTWSGGTFDVSNIPDWQCYRYKKFEAVVPLRNVIWMPTT